MEKIIGKNNQKDTYQNDLEPMTHKTTNDIRKAFIDFFVSEGHTHLPSSPLVPEKDPSLLFTNSGMVQFKNIFIGREKAPTLRAVTVQKCVRAGGKHNDLENVGYTARHHTFFEMLGNFSFGDYFKNRAIELAWRFVTQEFGLPKDRLYITVCDEDAEAEALWKKIAGVSPSHIIRISGSDNFWQMGKTGPCGPCSEIFYDHGSGIPGGPPGSSEEDGDRFVEIWNLVFLQYQRQKDGRLTPLPQPSIDTGMGLERMATVLQGKHNNYEIDLFADLIDEVTQLSGNILPETLASKRIITDHLRSCSFMLADGVFPSNEGRGYVLRRIMRRAIRHAHQLGVSSAMIYRLVPTLITLMGAHYRELQRAETLITETWRMEENRFRKTLDRGLSLLHETLKTLPKNVPLPGDLAFKLYDTYGFPLDLTSDILREQNRHVDIISFDKNMDEQRKKARKNWKGSGDQKDENLWFSLKDTFGNTEFTGYEHSTSEALILAQADDTLKEKKRLEKGQKGILILNQTVFYAESGGQVGDQGVIVKSSPKEECVFRVTDTQKKAGGLFCHIGIVESGSFTIDDPVILCIDDKKHKARRRHHSATHLLHAALRQILGPHVTQKGSHITQDALRFDFTHTKTIPSSQLAEIQTLINQKILENSAVTTRIMPADIAIESGAMALFGEKYGSEVRVITMGEAQNTENNPANMTNAYFSVELCGGTHVTRTGDIGVFSLLSQSSSASGIRRIEACCGDVAVKNWQRSEAQLEEVSQILKTPSSNLSARITHLLSEKQQLEKEIEKLHHAMLQKNTLETIEEISGIATILKILPDTPARALKPMIDQQKSLIKEGLIALVAPSEGKVSLTVGIVGDAIEKFDAVEIVNHVVPLIGGKKGGGRRDMAQSGGSDPAGMEKLLDAIRDFIKRTQAT